MPTAKILLTYHTPTDWNCNHTFQDFWLTDKDILIAQIGHAQQSTTILAIKATAVHWLNILPFPLLEPQYVYPQAQITMEELIILHNHRDYILREDQQIYTQPASSTRPALEKQRDTEIFSAAYADAGECLKNATRLVNYIEHGVPGGEWHDFYYGDDLASGYTVTFPRAK